MERDEFIHRAEFDNQSYDAFVQGSSLIISNNYTHVQALQIDMDNHVLGLHAINGYLCIGKVLFRGKHACTVLQRPRVLSGHLTFQAPEKGWVLQVYGHDMQGHILQLRFELTQLIVEVEVGASTVTIRSSKL